VLDAVVEYYRLLRERGYASSATIEKMALSSRTRSIDITSAIKHLVGLALLAVKPGAGARRNEYLIEHGWMHSEVVSIRVEADPDQP
jgi:hypothetical protein